ncbi:hypothetical protein N7471_006707 [Penicillium samsonianum]|uniref:uncharacterized protein n=1 Tax=Penicillium samsonianum TaxID=1882272 RepID=UPI0025488D5E|nr:uncharacterized protein N7471_006707 [Penicillium samsonianum]KAJ6140221.1 hypothetical protein N7471_006707 [Penicillium samsonianum]
MAICTGALTPRPSTVLKAGTRQTEKTLSPLAHISLEPSGNVLPIAWPNAALILAYFRCGTEFGTHMSWIGTPGAIYIHGSGGDNWGCGKTT